MPKFPKMKKIANQKFVYLNKFKKQFVSEAKKICVRKMSNKQKENIARHNKRRNQEKINAKKINMRK